MVQSSTRAIYFPQKDTYGSGAAFDCTNSHGEQLGALTFPRRTSSCGHLSFPRLVFYSTGVLRGQGSCFGTGCGSKLNRGADRRFWSMFPFTGFLSHSQLLVLCFLFFGDPPKTACPRFPVGFPKPEAEQGYQLPRRSRPLWVKTLYPW